MQNPRNLVLATLAGQLGVSVAFAVTCWVAWGRIAGYSALVGGLICVLSNAFLALRILAPGGDLSGRGMMRSAWAGEIGKLALTVLMFGATFALLEPISAAAVIGGYIAAQLVIFAALALGARA